jgi:N-acetylneuraminate synthase
VHAGAMSLNTKLNKNHLRSKLIDSLTEVDTGGIEMLFENLPPYPWYFGGQWKGNFFMDAEEIVSFCKETGNNICFDLSHAALYCNAKAKNLLDYIRLVKPYIRHLHIADAYGLDGEGVQVGQGDLDFNAIMPLFADYEGTWAPEIWRGHLQDGKGFLEALIFLKQFDI